MQIGLVLGNVTLSRCLPSLTGARLRLAIPLSLANLNKQTREASDEIVVYDELHAGHGTIIAVADGREAAQPFDPEPKPIDAYVAALLDHLDIPE